MQHESNRASRDTDEQCHCNGQADQQPAAEHGIRPDIAMPPTVLVTKLDNGTLIIQGRPDGPRLWLNPDEAAPLRRELVAAFARAKLAAIQDNPR